MAARREVIDLLQAAKDAADEDAPRLVLADWLEEHGDEVDLARAQYVRLECEAARLPAGDEQAALLKRAGSLFSRYRSTWAGDVAPLVEAAGAKVRLDRGERGLLRLAGDARSLASKKS